MSAEDSWVFDSLVCFLHGPVWNAPLQTFIEEKSLVFDPNLQLDENNAEIRQIHEEYKNLVDYMLGSFMEEMQISPEQFEQACLEGRQQGQGENPFQFHQVLFQQIWAANDLKIFIRMMTQRNVELQLQALDLIEKNQLSFATSTEQADDDSATGSDQGETAAEVELIAKAVSDELESPEAALTPDHDAGVDLVNDKFQRLNLFFEQQDKVDPNDVVSRQEYLRQQRDKIVEIKKQTRAKQLQDTVARSSAQATGSRPNSAQVAQRLMENGGKTTELAAPSPDSEESAALQLRRTLAKRLRSEVVEHN
ncbi:cilia- and flagella-associated protein 36 [Scaptodrosophila lebanonensis]|uniref:Cilia- and flagella-associated protein 36 n=1 Tax=Drosophila lebanonensis TaxID=7225 RepID=A0A6J2T461_DROLE|nr:cilia- and flagella-associated protein 36 [Scaptodrosophila lebanonensis]